MKKYGSTNEKGSFKRCGDAKRLLGLGYSFGLLESGTNGQKVPKSGKKIR